MLREGTEDEEEAKVAKAGTQGTRLNCFCLRALQNRDALGTGR